jgi:putative endonuclease
MYYCYVLQCADGSFYTGVTTDLVRRIEEHNGGRGSRYTGPRRPVRLVWTEEHPNRSSAQRREAEIKGWNRGQKETLIKGGIGGTRVKRK